MSKLEPLVEALRKRLTRLDERVFGTHADDGTQEQVLEDMGADSVIDAIQQQNERIAEIEADAQMAKASLAARDSTDGGESKKDIAIRLSRDDAVKQALDESNRGPRNVHGDRASMNGSVTVPDVQRMARPQTELAWKTIHDDAWRELEQRWPAFRIDDAESGKRLVADGEAITPELVRLVSDSLSDQTLANQVVGGSEGIAGGGRSD